MHICYKLMALLFNMYSRLIIAFLPRSKNILIPWLQLSSAVILELNKTKYFTVPIVSLSICHEVTGIDAMILVFWMVSFKTSLHSPLIFIKNLFSSSYLSAIRVVPSTYLIINISWYLDCYLKMYVCEGPHATWVLRHSLSLISRLSVLLPGKSHGWRSLVGCHPRGC